MAKPGKAARQGRSVAVAAVKGSWRRCSAVAVFSDDRQGTMKISLRERTMEICQLNRSMTEPLEKSLAKVESKINGKAVERLVRASLCFQTEEGTQTVCGSELNSNAWKTRGVHLKLEGPSESQEEAEEHVVTAPVFVDPPMCTKVSTLSCPLVGVPQSPVRLQLEGCKLQDCEWEWFVENADGTDRRSVGREFWYTPTESDVGMYLTVCCRPRFGGGGDPASVWCPNTCSPKADRPVEIPPDLSFRHIRLERKEQAPALRIATYNILAGAYTDGFDTFCDPKYVDNSYRTQIQLCDIKAMDADILSLQEATPGVLYNMAPTLARAGYETYFGPKRDMNGKTTADGVALLWRRDRLRPVRQPFQKILALRDGHLRLLPTELEALVLSHERTREVMEAVTTVGVFAVFEDLETGGRVAVATSHLFYHGMNNHVRLFQSAMLLEELRIMRTAAGENCAAVLLGDLNARKRDERHQPPSLDVRPTRTPVGGQLLPPQAAYRYLSGETIHPDDVDWEWTAFQWNKTEETPSDELKEGKWAKEEELLRPQMSLVPPVRLRDSCPQNQLTHMLPWYAECLDHIFVDEERMKVVRACELPTQQEMAAEGGGIPSRFFPSDHVPVVVDLIQRVSFS